MQFTIASIAARARDALRSLGAAAVVIATTLVLGLPASLVFGA